MSYNAIILLSVIAITAFAAAMELRALVILARSGGQKENPKGRERRRNLWGQVFISPAMVVAALPQAVTSDHTWRMACLLAGMILLVLYLLVLLWVRSADRRGHRSG